MDISNSGKSYSTNTHSANLTQQDPSGILEETNEIIDELGADDSYDSVGFHRLLGGWYYNSILFLFGIIFFVLMFTVIIPWLLPYPEITGYERIVYGLLGFTFGFFDFGSTKGGSADSSAQLNEGLLRFLGEFSMKNAYQALRYIQFFSWFQMFTGILQITLISIVAIFWFPFTEMGHLIWFILGYSLIQFPGCTQIYESIFKGFQRIDAWSFFTFIKDTFIKYGVQIACVLIGREYGRANPAFGEVMGATIGYIVSLWFIELTSFAVGTIVFKYKLGKKIGLKVSDIFIPDFDKALVKETLSFSFKLWLGSLYGQLIELFLNLMVIAFIPAYGVWLGLINFGWQLSAIVSMQGIMVRNATPAISESYLNEKKNLFSYYMVSLFKYDGFITTYLLVPVLLFFPTILSSLIDIIPGLEEYAPLTLMLPMILVTDAFIGPISSLGGRIYPATDKPLLGVIYGLIGGPIRLLLLWLFVSLGMSWESVILSRFLSQVATSILQLYMFHKKEHPLPFFKKNVIWQALIVPAITVLVTFPILYLMNQYIVIPWIAQSPIVAGVCIALFCLFGYSLFIFAPVYGFFGGFDEGSLEVFRQSINLAGPSKIIMRTIYKTLMLGIKISPFHDKHPLPFYQDAEQERKELNLIHLAKSQN